MTHQIKAYNLLYKKKLFNDVLLPVRGLKTAKKYQKLPTLAFFAILGPLQAIKHH